MHISSIYYFYLNTIIIIIICKNFLILLGQKGYTIFLWHYRPWLQKSWELLFYSTKRAYKWYLCYIEKKNVYYGWRMGKPSRYIFWPHLTDTKKPAAAHRVCRRYLLYHLVKLCGDFSWCFTFSRWSCTWK